jgi:hypothetical protein
VALLKGTKRPTPGLRPVFDRLVSHGKPDPAWARVPFVSLRYYAIAPAGFDIAIGSVTYISSCAKPSFCFARAMARQYFRTACSCFLSTSPLASTATQGRGS